MLPWVLSTDLMVAFSSGWAAAYSWAGLVRVSSTQIVIGAADCCATPALDTPCPPHAASTRLLTTTRGATASLAFMWFSSSEAE